MILLPAIDLFGGKAVRLYKGDYAQMTVYHDDPLAVARDFKRCGASWLHIVDLEGARDGGMPHLELAQRIAAETGLSVELGGGIRDMERVRRSLDSGVQRVVLGTAAVEKMSFVREAVESYGERIAVGADVRDGCIAVRGWREKSALSLEAFLEEMQGLGVKTVICTDISRDGAMRGTNRALYRSLSERFAMNMIASGGVSDLADVKALRDMGLYGAIVGKAYYTGALDLAEAIEVAR